MDTNHGSEDNTYSVFISYSHDDAGVADDICSILRGANRTFFRDVKNIDWGDNIGQEVRNALIGSQSVLVILSPASDGSAWVPFEVGYCSALGRKVLPYLTHPKQKIPGYISGTKALSSLSDVSDYFDKPAIKIPAMPDLGTNQKKPDVRVTYSNAIVTTRARGGKMDVVVISVANHDERPIFMNNVGLITKDNMKLQITENPQTLMPYYRHKLESGQKLDYMITRSAFGPSPPIAPNGIDPSSITGIVATDDIGRQYFADTTRLAGVIAELFRD